MGQEQRACKGGNTISQETFETYIYVFHILYLYIHIWKSEK